MSKYRFFNAKIAQFQGCPSILEGELHTENDRIVFVGNRAPDSTEKFDREIDCKGNLLLPGFKNAHAHTAMTFLRSHADDLPLQEWLTNQVFPYEGLLTPEDIYTLVQLGILEYLSSGITSALDMYFFRDATAQACIDAGFRLVFSCVGGDAKVAEAEYNALNNLDPLLSYRLGTHAQYTATEEQLKALIELAHQYKEPFCMHLHETRREVDECIGKTGMTALGYLDSLGAFEYGGTGYHLVHMTDDDMRIMKDHNMFAVSCPCSNLKLSSGIAPLDKMGNFGIRLALGTDGAASNNALDMFREMMLASFLQKCTVGPSAGDPLKILTMACSTGAHAMYLEDCDDLAEGKLADIIMLDLSQPNMQPVNNILKNVVYAGGKQNVIMTMIAGNILYENGVYLNGLDVESISQKSNEIIRRMEKAFE